MKQSTMDRLKELGRTDPVINAAIELWFWNRIDEETLFIELITALSKLKDESIKLAMNNQVQEIIVTKERFEELRDNHNTLTLVKK